jgi:hypothetical protein
MTMPKRPKASDFSQMAPPDIAEKLAKLITIRSPEYKTLYSNIFRPRVGAGDITIIFSKLTHSPSLMAVADVVEEQVEVVMSWPQLKMFTETLSTLVEAIDEEIGEIKLPTGFKPNIERQREAIRSMGYPPSAKKNKSL